MKITDSLKDLANYCGLGVEGERKSDPMDAFGEHTAQVTGGAVPLSDFLVYDYFDEEQGLFFNNNDSIGFWYEINPLVGSNEGLEKNLTLFFNDELPEDIYLQFLIIAGTDISDILDTWEQGRKYGGEILAHITKSRRRFIENCAKDFASSRDGRLARNFRTFVACSRSLGIRSGKSIDLMTSFKRKLENKLNTEKLSPRLMKAEDLIVIGRELLQPDFGRSAGKVVYSKYNNLSDQICKKFEGTVIKPESVIHEATNLQTRIFSPRELPESFSLSEMVALLGSGDRVIPARFVISYSLASSLGSGGTSRLTTQGMRSIHAAERDYTRHDISAREEAREWREVLDIHKKGERFLSESMLVMITSPQDNIDIAEESLKSLWNANDWKLGINNNLQLLSLLSTMPMSGSTYWKSLSFFKLTRNALSGEIVAKLPLQGEWRGVPQSGVLLMGRRGQLFNFNPFYRIGGGGNYNVVVIAPSGSGKTFTLEDLVTSCLAQGVAVFVMDIGASYKNICELLGGEMLRFDRGSRLSLNPFAGLSSSGAVYTKALSLLTQGVDLKKVAEITGLPQEKIEALAVGKSAASNLEKEKEGIEVLEIKDKKISGKTHFVTKDSMIYAKAMVASMCGLSGDVRGEAVIERAIAEGITEYGTELDITKLAKVFEELKDHRGNPVEGASAMSDSLYPYTEQGIHGRYFKSGKEASFKELLTLFELEEIKDDEPLLAVVLQIILMQITMQFLCGDRSRYFMLVVDEAWLIMDFAASFLERFARTVRKYGGSLVVCTQDLSSFSKGSSQRAILESSTWKLILQQKEEGITTFAKEEGYLPYLDLIRSVRKCSANRFSEILIDTNGAKVVGRLVTDPYSTALYSTEKDDFSFLMNEEKSGKSKHEAILQLSKKYGALSEDFRYVEKE